MQELKERSELHGKGEYPADEEHGFQLLNAAAGRRDGNHSAVEIDSRLLSHRVVPDKAHYFGRKTGAHDSHGQADQVLEVFSLGQDKRPDQNGPGTVNPQLEISEEKDPGRQQYRQYQELGTRNDQDYAQGQKRPGDPLAPLLWGLPPAQLVGILCIEGI